jgi:hypothetical protein
MAINDTILISTYNNVRTKVAAVLGQGTDDFGYGQSLSSLPVVEGGAISATDWDNLRVDLTRAYRHQTGLVPVITNIDEGLDIRWAYPLQYDALADSVVTNKDTIYTGATSGAYVAQVESAVVGYSTQGPGWGNNAANQRYIVQRYVASWANSELARWYFNSGGYLRLVHQFTYSTGSPNSKTVGWDSIITDMNSDQFTFDYVKYRQGVSGARTVFFPDIPGRTDGQYHDTTAQYTENYGYQQFRFLDRRSVEIFVMFVDNDSGDQQFGGEAGVGSWGGNATTPGTAVDEGVQGYIQSGLEYRRSTDVVVATTATVNVPLSFTLNSGATPATAPQTYDLTANHYTRNEGTVVRLTLSTTNVANGTAVGFTITGTGISAGELGLTSLGPNTNFFVIQNGIGFKDIAISADSVTEGTESFTVTTVSDPVSTITITINDTSTDPPPEYSFDPNYNGYL